jgi:hypothetical protein
MQTGARGKSSWEHVSWRANHDIHLSEFGLVGLAWGRYLTEVWIWTRGLWLSAQIQSTMFEAVRFDQE